MTVQIHDAEGRDITQAVRNLSDREKVKALLLSLLEELDVSFDNQGFHQTDYYRDEDGTLMIGNDGHNNPEWGDGTLYEAFSVGLIPTDVLVDRLIEGLAGKAST